MDWWVAAPLAAVDRAEGRLDAAVATLRAATDRAREEGVTWPLALGLVELAGCAAVLGDRELARASAEEAIETGVRLGNGWAVASARRVLGQVALEEGDPSRAQTLLHDALAAHASAGFLPDIIVDLEALAAVAAALDAWREAARLLAASERARDRIGLRRWPAEEHANIAQRRTARDRLSDAAFESAWAEGRALTVDEAVAYARRARGERRRPATGWASLTPAEQRVVALVVEGLTNQQIGERLFMSLGTVKTHLGHVFTKLELGSRTELVAEAVRRGGDRRES
jgi:DNA-binding CsgD family transcriptional regulator